MKSTMKKLLALLLALVLTLGMLPGALAAAPRTEPDDTAEADPLPETGPQDDKHMEGDVSTPSDEPLRPAGEDLYVPKRDVPSSYDSRNVSGTNYVTAVKSQAYGDCWAHAAMACIETYMIKHQVPVALNGTVGSAADLSINLSENHHAYFTYTHAYDALNMISNDYTTFGNNLFQFGGSGDLSMYSLMRWQGPANEGTSALAYNRTYDNTNSPTTSTISSQYAYNYDAGHVMSVIKIPTSNRNAVKQAIMEYGAGDFTYYSSDSSAADNTNGTYFCNQDSVVNTTSYHNIDHAVTVVGWDDNYSKYNFTTTPAGNGAWLIKNSWGTSYGQSGYYYISYYDTASYNSNTFFYAVEPIDNYDNNYQYDGTTNFSNTRYVSSGSSFAQAYTANGAEILEAVSLAAPANFSYTLKIYTGGELDVADPTTGATLVTQQSGTLTYAGYQKIELENPVNLAAGQRFIVLFTNTSTGSKDMPVDMVGTYSYGYGWNISWTHTAHTNSSYRCNSSWSNESASFNFRIKAYTSNASFNLTALSDNTAQGTVTVSGTRILVSPATGYGIDHVEVTSGTATYTVSGNTISVSATADCTLKVYFRRLDQHTVTFIAHNKVTTMTAYEGIPITLPTPEDEDITDPNNENYYATFYGWVPARCANADEEPATVWSAGDDYTASGDVTLYGLYWVEETLPSTLVESYDLVSGASNVTEGTYIITWSNTYYLPSETARQTPLAASGISANTSTNKLNVSSQNPITSDMKWDFTATNDGKFTISHTVTSGNSTTTYYLTAKDASTGIYVVTNSGMSGYTYTWSLSDNNTIGLGMKAAGSRYLWVYNNQDWRYYSTSTSSGTLRLYKDNSSGSEGGTVDYYTTDFPGDCTHSWGDWTVTTAATCSAGGVETRTCTLCGSTETRNTAALAHSWTPGTTVEPTCTAAGYTTYTCSLCGTTKQDDPIAALGHDWVASAVTEATCTTAGSTTNTCRRCGATETVETAALGHSYTDTVTAPTCTAAGYTTHTCSRCGNSYTDTPTTSLGHSWGAWTVTAEPTASADGSRTRTCSRCGATDTEAISNQPTVTGYNLTTNGDVSVNSFISVPEYLTDGDSGMYVTINGGTPILLSSLTAVPDANGCALTADGFKFSQAVPAKNMQDTVTLRLYAGNGTQVAFEDANEANNGGGITYSVQGYINQVLADADAYDASYPGLSALCKAMSAYGSYAQVQQNYTTATGAAYNPITVDAATASEVAAISTASIPAAATASTATTSGSGVSFYGASLVMLSEMSLRFYFTYEGSGTLTCGGQPLTQKGDYYYVDVTGIAAKDFGVGKSVTVSDGTNSCTVSGYSVNRYVYKVLTTSSSANMVTLAKAIANYGLKATAYYSANNS